VISDRGIVYIIWRAVIVERVSGRATIALTGRRLRVVSPPSVMWDLFSYEFNVNNVCVLCITLFLLYFHYFRRSSAPTTYYLSLKNKSRLGYQVNLAVFAIRTNIFWSKAVQHAVYTCSAYYVRYCTLVSKLFWLWCNDWLTAIIKLFKCRRME